MPSTWSDMRAPLTHTAQDPMPLSGSTTCARYICQVCASTGPHPPLKAYPMDTHRELQA